MSEYEKLEFRICIIGEDFVGKKSIINRFRNIKSTETIEFNDPIIEKTIKPKKLRNKPCDSTLIPIIIPKIKTKQDNLSNFTKIFRIEKNYLEINIFYIPAAEKIGFSDNLNEEDEVEKIHKIKFENIRNAFQKITLKPSKNNLPIRYLLMFVFDITNSESFEKIKIYYEEITKNLHFEKSYFRILLGNKIDMKIPYEDIDKDLLDSFIDQKNLTYYEISTKLTFNFTGFFEKMFFECFESTFPIFSSDIFKLRFKNVLNAISTVPNELRNKTFTVNDIPGPQKYDTNIYDLTNEEGDLFLINI